MDFVIWPHSGQVRSLHSHHLMFHHLFWKWRGDSAWASHQLRDKGDGSQRKAASPSVILNFLSNFLNRRQSQLNVSTSRISYLLLLGSSNLSWATVWLPMTVLLLLPLTVLLWRARQWTENTTNVISFFFFFYNNPMRLVWVSLEQRWRNEAWINWLPCPSSHNSWGVSWHVSLSCRTPGSGLTTLVDWPLHNSFIRILPPGDTKA